MELACYSSAVAVKSICSRKGPGFGSYSSQPLVTPISADPMLYDLHKHQACTWCTCIHVGKILYTENKPKTRGGLGAGGGLTS